MDGASPPAERKRTVKILTIDVGGSHVKALVTGAKERRRFDSGVDLTPKKMVAEVKKICEGWSWDAVSIGYPGVVKEGKIIRDPVNLGRGWVHFDFAKAFGCPTAVVNDAAMQALGSYEGGRMLFLGLGTGLGTAMVSEGHLLAMELAHLPYRKGRSYEEYVGEAARKRLGPDKWSKHVCAVIDLMKAALGPDEVVLGGGNARRLEKLPAGVRLGENANAFVGGFRLWKNSPSSGERGNSPSGGERGSGKA
jgi:predicted NBD/HSP70 family sugar kinase